MQMTNHICYKGNGITAHSYFCKTSPYPDNHDKSKCIENGRPDPDCCAVKGTAKCDGSWDLKWLKQCTPGSKAYRYACQPPAHDKTKCMSLGSSNADCCAVLGTGECKDGYTFTRGDGCPGLGKYSFTCSHPDYKASSGGGEGVIIGVVVALCCCIIVALIFVKLCFGKNKGKSVSDSEEMEKLRMEKENLELMRKNL